MDMFDCILIQINSNRKHMLFSVGWLVALLYLTSLSTIFQLYRGGQFY
jgi:hypothetical protein